MLRLAIVLRRDPERPDARATDVALHSHVVDDCSDGVVFGRGVDGRRSCGAGTGSVFTFTRPASVTCFSGKNAQSDWNELSLD